MIITIIMGPSCVFTTLLLKLVIKELSFKYAHIRKLSLELKNPFFLFLYEVICEADFFTNKHIILSIFLSIHPYQFQEKTHQQSRPITNCSTERTLLFIRFVLNFISKECFSLIHPSCLSISYAYHNLSCITKQITTT